MPRKGSKMFCSYSPIDQDGKARQSTVTEAIRKLFLFHSFLFLSLSYSQITWRCACGKKGAGDRMRIQHNKDCLIYQSDANVDR